MMEHGLFDRFPCDAVFGMHNWPGAAVGTFGVTPGPMMASANQFEITNHRPWRACGHAAQRHRPDHGRRRARAEPADADHAQQEADRHRRAVHHADPCRRRVQHRAQRGGATRHGPHVHDRGAGPDRDRHATHRRRHRRDVRRDGHDDFPSRLSAVDQSRERDRLRDRRDARCGRSRQHPDRRGADDGRRGLRVHAAGEAGLLCLHRQRRRHASRDGATAWDRACCTTRATTSTMR